MTCLVLAPSAGSSQASGNVHDQNAQGGGPPDFGGHWSFRWSELYEDQALLGEAGFGLILGGHSGVGLAGVGTIRPSTYGTLDFSLAYGGFRAERDVWERGRWGASVAFLVGGGRFATEDTATDAEESTGIGVFEPEATLGLRVAGSFRVSVGASYRWVTGIEGDIRNRSDGDARSAALVLMFSGR